MIRELGNNSQSRKWALVLNNPLDYGLTHEVIIELLNRFSPTYYCMADEIATTGTYHTHVFLYSESPIRFTTMKNRFPTAHIEKAYGSVRENRDYVRKEGKWADTEKAETSVPDSFVEWGIIPTETAERAPQLSQLIGAVKEGQTTTEILAQAPNYALRVKDIEFLRRTLVTDKYASELRDLKVIYVFGAQSTIRTKKIYEENEPKEIYRITTYRKGKGLLFDGYHTQSVLVFENFASQIPIEEMMDYLGEYPLLLQARYNDHIACYTTVYISSNLPVTEQYLPVQSRYPELYQEFLGRIQKILCISQKGESVEVDL